MKFQTAARLTKTLLVCSVAFCILGLFLNSGELVVIRMVLTILAMLMLTASIIVTLVFCKCPYCGKRIFFGASSVAYCPNCRRNLETGKKGSKKKAATTRRKY